MSEYDPNQPNSTSNPLYVSGGGGGGGGGNAAASSTGEAVPTSADYQGVGIGGNLIGVSGQTVGGNTGECVDLNSVAGSAITLGQAVAASSLPVVLPAAQITALTPPTSVTASAGTNLNTSALALESGGNLATLAGCVTNAQLISLPYCLPANMISGTASATTTATTQVIAAQGSGVRIYVTSLIFNNTSSTSTYVNVLDGSTTRLVYPVPANGGAVHSLNVPLRLTANNALQFSAGTGETTIYVSAVGYFGQ